MFVSLLLFSVALSALYGFRATILYLWIPVVLFAPVRTRMGLAGDLVLDLRIAVMLGVLPFLVFARDRGKRKILLADLLVVGLFLAKTLSLLHSGELRVMSYPALILQWICPYLLGRWMLTSPRDLDRTIRALAIWGLIAGIAAVVEALSRVNILNKLMGHDFGLLEQGEGYRWGLKRAQAGTEHPIYFGVIMVLLFPFALEAGRRFFRREGPAWWLLVPLSVLAAVVVTVSRGAQLAAVMVLYAAFTLSSPWLRVPILAASLVGGGMLWANKDAIIPMFSSMLSKADTIPEDEREFFKIKDVQYEYTGDMHRVLLFKVYEDAIKNAGLLGYGEDTRKLMAQLDEEIAQRFWSIDNHYLLFYLQTGVLGVGMFLALTSCVLWYFFRIAWDLDSPYSFLAACCWGAFLGVGIGLWSVWFTPDFGAVWLFCAGIASSMRILSRSGVQGPPPKLRLVRPRLRRSSPRMSLGPVPPGGKGPSQGE